MSKSVKAHAAAIAALVKIKPPPEPKPAADLGAPGLAAAARPTEDARIAGRVVARRYQCECTLDAYNARGQLPDWLWRAGCIFRGHYKASVSQARVVSGYGEARGGSGDMHADVKTGGALAYDRALAALDPDQQKVVIAVCGEGEWAGHRMRQLHGALAVLAWHYRVPSNYCR